MTVLVVAGLEAGAGATTVAAGLAHRLTYAGHPVRLVRLAGDPRAEADAAAFESLEVADSSGVPASIASVTDTPGTVTIVEAPLAGDPVSTAGRLAQHIAPPRGGRLVLVGHAGASVPAGATFIENHAPTAGPLRLAEDRTLAAPTVRWLIEASGAQVLSRSRDGEDAVCEHLVIGAISHDAADAYFNRFPHRAVITRSEKVDLALAAMHTGSECLILTGGHEPSPYLLDRAAATRATTLLLAAGGTVETMRDLEGAFGAAPFAGATKLERIGDALRAALDDDALAALIA